MTVIILNYNDSSVHIENVESDIVEDIEDELWEMGYKDSEICWMELKDINTVQEALLDYQG